MIVESTYDFAPRFKRPNEFAALEVGKSYEAKLGVDFDSVDAFRMRLSRYAARLGARVKTRTHGEVLYFRMEPMAAKGN